MSFKLQDKKMEKFLETYQQYECLRNTKCSDYCRSTARKKAHSSMLNDLNLPILTVADTKPKIKTIRTRYVAKLSKLRNSEQSGAAVDDVYEPRLFWFKDADVFLRNVCTSKHSYIILKNHLKKIHIEKQDILVNKMSKLNNNRKTFCTTSSDISGNSSAVSTSTETLFANSQHCQKLQKRCTNSYVPVVYNPINQRMEISEDNKQDLNEFDVFCQSLAIQLKKMPLNRGLICQEKLQQVMTQERLSQITHPHPLILPSSSTNKHSLANQNSNQNHLDHSQEHDYQFTGKLEFSE